MPAIHLRKLISENPSAAAFVFDRVMRAFFSILAGIPFDDFRGKRANVDRLLSVHSHDYVGAFGRLNSAYEVIEAQSSSLLHAHFHLFGSFDHSLLAHWVHDDGCRKEITKAIDDVVTARLPIHIGKEEE